VCVGDQLAKDVVCVAVWVLRCVLQCVCCSVWVGDLLATGVECVAVCVLWVSCSVCVAVCVLATSLLEV